MFYSFLIRFDSYYFCGGGEWERDGDNTTIPSSWPLQPPGKQQYCPRKQKTQYKVNESEQSKVKLNKFFVFETHLFAHRPPVLNNSRVNETIVGIRGDKTTIFIVRKPVSGKVTEFIDCEANKNDLQLSVRILPDSDINGQLARSAPGTRH